MWGKYEREIETVFGVLFVCVVSNWANVKFSLVGFIVHMNPTFPNFVNLLIY